TVNGLQRKLYSFNGQVVAQRDNNTAVTFLHTDHLGSVTVLTTASGSLLSAAAYSMWGSGGPSSAQSTIGYTGQRRTAGGLLYYGARYYRPALGLFVSPDPVVPATASGDLQGTAVAPLTVNLATETGLLTQVNDDLRALAHAIDILGAVAGGIGVIIETAKQLGLVTITAGSMAATIVAALIAVGTSVVVLHFGLENAAETLKKYGDAIEAAIRENDEGVIISTSPGWGLNPSVNVVNRGTGNGVNISISIPVSGGLFSARGPHLKWTHGAVAGWLPGYACTLTGGDPKPGNYFRGDTQVCSDVRKQPGGEVVVH
ncbi:MAG TPA: RHS repeat-associated core domain-containing protein, partial [Kribbellaceae bacterium]|nr:RHS repeat-associated core domain-containing protein [Kribbellaceae bacterium]